MYKYFKDADNQVYAYEADGSQDSFILDGLQPITEEEAMELSKPQPIVPTQCTAGQGLVALFALRGVTEDYLKSQLDAIPDPIARYTAQIAYSRSTLWERSSQTVQLMAELLLLSETDLDLLFAHATTVRL